MELKDIYRGTVPTVNLSQMSIRPLVDGGLGVWPFRSGSPATTVSLKFRARTKDQTNQQWKRFTDPDVTLKSYGGFQLHFMAQIELSLARGNYRAEVTALVKKDAPNDLLYSLAPMCSQNLDLPYS